MHRTLCICSLATLAALCACKPEREAAPKHPEEDARGVSLAFFVEEAVDLDPLPFYAVADVAHVDGQPISAAAFNIRAAIAQNLISYGFGEEELTRFRRETLDELIAEKLIAVEAARAGVVVTDEEVYEESRAFDQKDHDSFSYRRKAHFGRIVASKKLIMMRESYIPSKEEFEVVFERQWELLQHNSSMMHKTREEYRVEVAEALEKQRFGEARKNLIDELAGAYSVERHPEAIKLRRLRRQVGSPQ